MDEGLTARAALAGTTRIGGVMARSSSRRLARVLGSSALGDILVPFAARVDTIVQVEARVLFLHGGELLKRGSRHDGGHADDLASAATRALAAAEASALAACRAYRVAPCSSLQVVVSAEARELPLLAGEPGNGPDALGLHRANPVPDRTFVLDDGTPGRVLGPRVIARGVTWSSSLSREENEASRAAFVRAVAGAAA